AVSGRFLVAVAARDARPVRARAVELRLELWARGVSALELRARVLDACSAVAVPGGAPLDHRASGGSCANASSVAARQSVRGVRGAEPKSGAGDGCGAARCSPGGGFALERAAPPGLRRQNMYIAHPGLTPWARSCRRVAASEGSRRPRKRGGVRRRQR